MFLFYVEIKSKLNIILKNYNYIEYIGYELVNFLYELVNFIWRYSHQGKYAPGNIFNM